MVMSRQTLASKREEILRIARTHGVISVRVFGSVARGDAGAGSDVDLLVDFEPGRSTLDQIALWQDLQDLLGSGVDIVDAAALHWFMKDRVLREAVDL